MPPRKQLFQCENVFRPRIGLRNNKESENLYGSRMPSSAVRRMGFKT